MIRKKFTCIIILALTIALISSLCLTSAAFAEQGGVELVVTTSGVMNGNIFAPEHLPGFCVEISNNGTAERTAALSCSVAQNGETVWSSGDDSLTLNAHTTIMRGVSADTAGKNGVFTFTATLSGDFGTVTQTADFAIAPANDDMSDYSGLSCHFGKGSREQIDLCGNLIPAAGVGWVREEILWTDVETVKGKYAVPDYNDDFVNKLLAQGNNILLILNYGNSFYENKGFPITADGLKGYAGYCAYMAEYLKEQTAKYPGTSFAVEAWNEPNYSEDRVKPEGGEPRYPTGQEYAALCKAAYDAVKSVDPSITVIGGSMTTLSTYTTYQFIDAAMTEMDANYGGVANCMDAFSFHPYANTGMFCDEYTNSIRDISAVIGDAHRLLNSHNVSKMPIWITEFGSSNGGEYPYSLRDQAINHVRAMTIAKSDSQVDKFFIYNLKEKGTNQTNMEHRFGLLDYDYNAKDAYVSMAALNCFIGAAQPTASYTNTSRGTRCFSAYQFKDGKDDIFVIWKNDSKSGNVTLTVTQDLNQDAETTIEGAVTENEPKIHAAENIKTEVYDMFGNNITSADGTYNITKEPIYVVLEAESEDVRESDNIEVNNETGQVSVRCGNAIPGADVTLLARQQNAVGNPIYYIGQTKAGLSGAYAFDFTIKPDDICSIKVYSKGGSGVFNVGNERYEITVDYLLNGEPFNDYSKASGGDEITARANVKPRDGSQAGSLILYGVVTSDGIMEDSAMTEFYSADGTESAELSMKPESQEDLNTLRFMLWNDKMQPLMGAAGIKD